MMEDNLQPVYVQKVTERSERYIYHGKDEINRAAINHNYDKRSAIDIEGVEWPYSSPEECQDYSPAGKWYRVIDSHKEYLLCQGCGLDCT